MNPQEAKKLEKKIHEIFTKYLSKNDTVIAGISGGPDSIFLLKFLAELPLKIHVAHLNHQLRKESGNDEKFVKDFTQKTSPNILFHSKSVDIKKISKKSKKGIEETGRTERYKFFNQLAKKHNATFIITAHHADDNLETIILNLTRGATLQGLTGMKTLDKNLLRPLLPITKAQIQDYLKFKKTPYLTDKSNLTDDYNRNLIRNRAIPHLKKINPNIALTTAKNTENLREIQDYLTTQAQNWLKRHNTTNKLPSKSLAKLHPALQKTIIRELYKFLTGDTKNLENTHVDEILHLINQNIGNKQKKFGKLLATLKNGTITIEKL
ncbi:MAG: tRNA lysidine(34) synthetase TilS [Nitrospirae bacterium]|nr:tRNA lysidine(34) synthetase TilS [Nitrospirota bacterium]